MVQLHISIQVVSFVRLCLVTAGLSHQISPVKNDNFRLIYLSDLHLQISDSFGLCFVMQTHPLHLPLSASCSSDRDFAADFLQIPPHDGHPCLELTLPTIMVCSGFSPYSYRPCRANNSKHRLIVCATEFLFVVIDMR